MVKLDLNLKFQVRVQVFKFSGPLLDTLVVAVVRCAQVFYTENKQRQTADASDCGSLQLQKCLLFLQNLILFVAWNLPESEPEQPDPQASKDDSLREPFEETDPTPEWGGDSTNAVVTKDDVVDSSSVLSSFLTWKKDMSMLTKLYDFIIG